MNKKPLPPLHTRRAQRGATTAAILDILEKEGPLPMSMLKKKIGRNLDMCCTSLVKKGLVSAQEMPNFHAQRSNSHAVVKYYSFISRPIIPPKKEVKPPRAKTISKRVQNAILFLQGEGYKVLPPELPAT